MADAFDIEPGRPFDPEHADPDADRADAAEPDAAPLPPLGVASTGDIGAESALEVTEETVRSLLVAQGSLVHGLVAIDKDSDEWVWLRAELEAIVPPLTRIANRYDPVRQLAAVGDPLAVGVALFGHARRSLEERAADIARARAELERQAAETGEVRFRFAGDGSGDE